MNNTPLPPTAGVSSRAPTDSNRLLSSGLEQQRQIRLQAIQTITGLKTEEITQAVVEKITSRPLTNQASATQSADRLPAPGTATQPAPLPTGLTLPASGTPSPGQQQLLTLLAELKNTPTPPQINQADLKIGSKVLSVLTSLPLKQGQLINLSLTAAGDLKIEANSLNISKISAELTQALRESLPNQRPITELMQQLKQIVQNPVLNQALLTPTLRRPLTQVLQQALQVAQKADTPALKQAIAHSGIQFESKLQQATAPVAGAPHTVTASSQAVVQQDLKGLLLNLKHDLEKTTAFAASQATTKGQTSIATSSPPLNTHPPASANNPGTGTNTDKAMIYSPTGRLLNNIPEAKGTEAAPIPNLERGAGASALASTVLGSNTPPDAAKVTGNPMLATTLPAFTSALAQFFGGGVKQAGEFDIKQLRTQMTVLLHRQLLQTLAAITGKQAASLSRQQATGSEGSTLLQWNLELPLRMGEHIVPLFIDIEEKPEQDSEAKSSDTEKTRRWEVRMSFELPDEGSLHAHIRLLQSTVSASLWAEEPGLLAKAKGKLTDLRSNLEKNGITVDKIDCQHGKPPAQANALGYALVDIKT